MILLFKLRDERLLGPELHATDSEWFALEMDVQRFLKSREAHDILARLSVAPAVVQAEAPSEPIARYFDGQLRQARLRVEEIEKQIDVRSALHSEALAQLDYQISKSSQSLGEFIGHGVGYNTGVDMKRNHLERQLAMFRRDRRENRLRTWQDLSALRKELQQSIAEYQDLYRRYRLAGGQG